MKSCGKIKHCDISSEKIVTYDTQQKLFKIFDTQTKGLLFSIQEFETPGRVNMLKLRGNTLAYIKGRSVIVHDISSEKHQAAPR